MDPQTAASLHKSYNVNMKLFITVVDEGRSCSVTASRNPVHIISSSQKICGTASHPWHVEVSDGQRINISLIKSSTVSNSGDAQLNNKKSCQSRGFILDKAGNRNTTICGGGSHRENELYLSTGSTVDIILLQPAGQLHSSDDDDSALPFVLKLEGENRKILKLHNHHSNCAFQKIICYNSK